MNLDITGHEYERACAKKLKKQGFTNVKVTKGSGDQGIDIVAFRDGEKYGIQCKYYSSPVGNHAVQEAYAGAKYYECDYAIVMTNSTFTKSAHELAAKIGVQLWENNRVEENSSCLGCIGCSVICIILLLIIGLIADSTTRGPSLIVITIVSILWIVLKKNFSSKRSTETNSDKTSENLYQSDRLDYFRTSFSSVTPTENSEYITLISKEIRRIKDLADTLNCTKDINVFINSFTELDNRLAVLSKYEFTNLFAKNHLPSVDRERILKNKSLTEIDFIKRAYFQDETSFLIPEQDVELLSSFSTEAHKFIKTQNKPIIYKTKSQNKMGKYMKKNMSTYELEIFAKQCNAYLEHEDKKRKI